VIFLNRTKYGVAVRASAANPDAARLAGIGIKRMSTIVWAIAGVLAVVATVLSAPFVGATTVTSGALGPSMLLRTFAVAILARLTSLPIALGVGVAVGIGEGLLYYNLSTEPGIVDGALLLLVLVGVVLISLRPTGLGVRERVAVSPRIRPIPPELRSHWLVRHHTRIGGLLALLAAVLVPLVVTSPSRHYLYARVLIFALAALSLTVLTGWAGQLSLGQFALAGVGGMTTYALVQNQLVFPVALLLGVVAAVVAALLIGAPALRMRGLLLAVTTLAFAVAAPWLLSRSVFVGGEQFLLMRRQVVWGVSLESQRTYYYVSLGALAVAIVVIARIRRSGIGRSLLAVRDNELAAATMGISPVRTKLLAFGVSGALAGLAGGLFVGLLVQFQVEQFSPSQSLSIVAMVVVGGFASITGSILGALVIVGLPAFFPGTPEIVLLTSGVGVLILLLYFRGGLVQLLFNFRDLVLGVLARRLPPPDTVQKPPVPARVAELVAREDAPIEGPVLDTREVGVRFGVRRVLDEVSLHLKPGEIVGLIGANGAGKSTLMNAISGFVPASGTIHVLGRDVSSLPPHKRAAMGLGRTFQDAALFPDLTVRETVATAVEMRGHAGLFAVALALPQAKRLERAKQTQATEILDFLGMGSYGERFVGELSTGMRRILELACLLAVDAKVLCLDEPTAGVAQRETEAFGPLLLRIRAELDASMLVIEHDMPLVMSISDRVYCLELGRIIAEGTPEAVRNDPIVVASYLGTDEVAIARSSALS
jgi:ABC-type branched-subunit amino acid transport system ATPase component/ABC-type branched-subunit amino acid transport system permease subunit